VAPGDTDWVSVLNLPERRTVLEASSESNNSLRSSFEFIGTCECQITDEYVVGSSADLLVLLTLCRFDMFLGNPDIFPDTSIGLTLDFVLSERRKFLQVGGGDVATVGKTMKIIGIC
jgi:hypothetical protein